MDKFFQMKNYTTSMIFVCKNNILLISDEIYHGIEFEKSSKSILNFGQKAIVINSFSKYFLMPRMEIRLDSYS